MPTVLSQKVILCHVNGVMVTDISEECCALSLGSTVQVVFHYLTLKIEPF